MLCKLAAIAAKLEKPAGRIQPKGKLNNPSYPPGSQRKDFLRSPWLPAPGPATTEQCAWAENWAGGQRALEPRIRGELSCSRLGTPPPRDWGGLQAAPPLPRLRARARSRRGTPRRGASSEPGRFKGLTRSSTRPDGKLRHSFCEDAPAPRGV